MATKQKSLAEQIGEELTCPICIHRLKDPKVLPCLHTFCKECLVAATRGKTDATCPKCRESHPLPNGGVDKLLTNFPANSLLELLEVHEVGESEGDAKKTLTCENGVDENDAVARCLDCNIYLCGSCWSLHKKQVMSRKHKTVSLSEIKDAGEKCLQKPHYCTEHEAELLKLYCKTCSKAICGDCTYVEHRDHKYVFIKDVQSELRKQLESVVSDLAKQENELSTQLEGLHNQELKQVADMGVCKEQIARKAAEMRQTIDAEEAKALEAADAILHSRQKEIKAEEDSVALSLAKVSSNLSFMQRLLKSGSDVEIASAGAQAVERSKQLSKLKKEASEIEFPYMVCEASPACNICIVAAELKVIGIQNIAVGPNTLHIIGNDPSIKPVVSKLHVVLTCTIGTPENVNFTLCLVKNTTTEWNMDFVLCKTGSVELQLAVGTAEFHETVQVVDKMCVGARVRRGPDWKWGDQDGHGTGTIVPPGPRVMNGWIAVQWDNGQRKNYRWTAENLFDVVIV